MERKFEFYAIKLSVLIILVFGAQVMVGGFTDVFILNELSWNEPWRFVTAIFLHGGLGHLVLNLFALVLFGSILERFIGGFRLLLVFFVTGILANLVSINFYSSSLGASGAIFGVIGALVFVRPLMTVWAFGMPMPIFVAGILWGIGDVLGAYGFFTGRPLDNTGNIAHLSGMFFGFIFGVVYRRLLRRKIKKRNVSIDEDTIRMWEDQYMG